LQQQGGGFPFAEHQRRRVSAGSVVIAHRSGFFRKSRPDVCLEPFDLLARLNAFRFHVSDKLIDLLITMQALDVGINLRLLWPPCRVNGILGMQSVYTLDRGWFGLKVNSSARVSGFCAARSYQRQTGLGLQQPLLDNG
jgi:hypothetical protein